MDSSSTGIRYIGPAFPIKPVQPAHKDREPGKRQQEERRKPGKDPQEESDTAGDDKPTIDELV